MVSYAVFYVVHNCSCHVSGEQACMRPNTADGLPVMGGMGELGCEGVYISAG